jgi:hypothetical protein
MVTTGSVLDYIAHDGTTTAEDFLYWISANTDSYWAIDDIFDHTNTVMVLRSMRREIGEIALRHSRDTEVKLLARRYRDYKPDPNPWPWKHR